MSDWQLVILAAGRGSRFAGPLPKLLAPVRDGQGMLELLLRSLLQELRLPPQRLAVVAGGEAAPAVRRLVRGIDPAIRLPLLVGSTSRGPVHSLAAALADQPPTAPPCWVLHGDTHYPRAVLERLLAEALSSTPLLLVEPVAAQAGAPVEVGVRLAADGRVIALGPGCTPALGPRSPGLDCSPGRDRDLGGGPGGGSGGRWPWRMLPAVAWPMAFAAACRAPQRWPWSQWQLLDALLQEQPGRIVQVVKLPASGIFDVDTLPAWREARRRLAPPPEPNRATPP